MPIDFKALARDLRERARDVLPSWLPAGRFRGREFVVGSVQGEAGDSLSVNWTTGAWKDFATADLKGGDLLSLFAAINNVSMSEAARLLGAEGYSDPEKAKGPLPKVEKARKKIVAPAPKSAGIPPCVTSIKDNATGKWNSATASTVWIYRDAAGLMLGAVARYDLPYATEVVGGETVYIWEDGRRKGKKPKIHKPWTWQIDGNGKGAWRTGSWEAPRPMYGLDDLAARPTQPVLLVEGEKCADAARMLMPQYVCMSWPGGSGGYTYVDFTPLKGRKILLWPDADDIGVSVMWAIGYKLLRICPSVKIIIPGADLPDGWDVADAIKQEGFNSVDGDARWQFFKAWALPLIQELKEDFSDGLPNEEEQSGTGTEEDQRGDDVGADVDRRELAGEAGEGNSRQEAAAEAPHARGDAGESRRPVAKRSRKISDRASKDSPATGGTDRLAEKPSDEVAPPPRLRREIYWSQWRFDVSPGNGTPLQNLSNAVATLEQDPDWKGRIWYDTFLQRIQVQTEPKVAARNWQDFDDINLTLYMQRTIGLTKISKETVAMAVVQVAMSNLRNCVTDWLDGLKWDGVERMGHFFEDHFGADASVYTRAVSRNFWMSVVARAYMPGCKQDYMVVLEGGQGKKKSTACAAIASEPWFVISLASIDTNEFFKVLEGKLIVEIGELEAFNSKGEMNRVKNVVSCPKDVYRGSYERHVVDHYRQCVFIGTTNRSDWNKDDTGARRFWPIHTRGEIDLDAIRAGREQLYAEAVSKLKVVSLDPERQPSLVGARVEAGADWWMIPVAEAEVEQEKRFDEDSWRPYVEDFIGLRQEVRTGEILVDALKVDVGKIKRADEMRVGSVLRSLGWESVTRRESGKVARFWVKKEGEEF